MHMVHKSVDFKQRGLFSLNFLKQNCTIILKIRVRLQFELCNRLPYCRKMIKLKHMLKDQNAKN